MDGCATSRLDRPSSSRAALALPTTERARSGHGFDLFGRERNQRSGGDRIGDRASTDDGELQRDVVDRSEVEILLLVGEVVPRSDVARPLVDAPRVELVVTARERGSNRIVNDPHTRPGEDRGPPADERSVDLAHRLVELTPGEEKRMRSLDVAAGRAVPVLRVAHRLGPPMVLELRHRLDGAVRELRNGSSQSHRGSISCHVARSCSIIPSTWA